MKIAEYLNEKVIKRDIDAVLTNSNFMIGGEFEFIIPDFLEKRKELVAAWEKITDYEAELTDYEDEFEQWEDATEDGQDIPMPMPPKWAVDLGYEPGDEIPPPRELFPEFENTNEKTIFKALVKEFLPVNKLPFKNYIITTDSNAKSSTKWIIKPDGSLGASGIEITSPVMPITEFVKVCPKVFEFINEYGDSNNSCGFHTGMSVKNVKSLGKVLDIVKLALFTDEKYIYKFFDMRKYNQYAKSAHLEVKKSITFDEIKKFLDTKKMEVHYSDAHHMAINIEHLHTDNEYIEFRYLGGQQYHRKWNRVKNTIAQYGYNLLLACDPEFRRKEYLQKLNRIATKVSLYNDMLTIGTLKTGTSDYIKLSKKIKALQNDVALNAQDIEAFSSTGIDAEDVIKKMSESLF